MILFFTISGYQQRFSNTLRVSVKNCKFNNASNKFTKFSFKGQVLRLKLTAKTDSVQNVANSFYRFLTINPDDELRPFTKTAFLSR